MLKETRRTQHVRDVRPTNELNAIEAAVVVNVNIEAMARIEGDRLRDGCRQLREIQTWRRSNQVDIAKVIILATCATFDSRTLKLFYHLWLPLCPESGLKLR
jgi:hypothetical protein